MSQKHTTAIVVALLLVLAAAVPATAAAETTLAVGVEQDDAGAVTVTVTDDGTVVDNATVNVSTVDENATYAGVGEYTTDENGTVSAPAPDEDVTVYVEAVQGDRTGNTTATLSAPSLDVEVASAPDGSANVWVTYAITGNPAALATVNVSTVDENDTYEGAGEYTAGEDGTITLDPPEETVTLRLNASAGGVEGHTTTILQNASTVGETYDSFGAWVSAQVHILLGSHDGGIGRMVADFVTKHNPGNPPDNAGPPAGEPGKPDVASSQGSARGNASDDRGKPASLGNDDRGRPDDPGSNGKGHDK